MVMDELTERMPAQRTYEKTHGKGTSQNDSLHGDE